MDKILFLISAFLLVWGLRLQSDPASASRGNKFAAVGMLIAIFSASIMPLDNSSGNYIWILTPIVFSAVIGYIIAKKIQMTSMPQMVSIFNGLGGLSAVLLSYAEINKWILSPESYPGFVLVVLIVSLFIGSVAFTGSLLAFAKLDGYRWSEKLTLPFQHIINLILLFSIAFSSYLFIDSSGGYSFLYIIISVSLIYGIFFVAPIGGADMPVVISMLNSYSGWAAAGIGFTLENTALIITGALVGSSGAILSYIMCKGMNRSFFNVILGGFGATDQSTGDQNKEQRPVKSGNAEDASFLMKNASSVIIVPGYGMAVAQAQHALREMVDTLKKLHHLHFHFSLVFVHYF